jgi:hypothetical protein
MQSSFVLLLLLLGGVGGPSLSMAQSPGNFTAIGNMTAARSGHSATLLANGKVLIAGGRQKGVNATPDAQGCIGLCVSPTAELYDPGTGRFTPTGNMTTARFGHSGTLLADGRVLIAGGYDEIRALVSAEFYDPSTGTFTATDDITTGGCTFLPDGEVLIFGYITELSGHAAGACAALGPSAITTFTRLFSATLLADGKVLVFGDAGCCSSIEQTEVYDPGTGKVSFKGPIPDLLGYAATLLMDGKVLISGGEDAWGNLDSAELYDPMTGIFSYTTRPMTTYRESSLATLLPDGTVLISGGQLYGGGATASAEVYDPGTGMFSATGNMITPRFGYTATLLPDGTVLIAGGLPYFTVPTASAEIYTPQTLLAAPRLLSLSGDGRGEGAIQHADTYQLVSSSNPAGTGEVIIIYCTGLADRSVVPPQVAIGGRMADVLWFGNTPGFAGLNQINVRVPSGITPGPSVPVGLQYLGRPTNEVTIDLR